MLVPKTPEHWQKNNIARLAAAVTFLRANGNDDIFIAGDGLGALLVNAYLVDTPGSGIKGAILIAPRRPHTAKPTATTALDVPLLDLLPARTHITEARQRRLTLMNAPDEHLLVYCTCPDDDVAERLAGLLVERRMAACVNIIGPVRSIYRWQGKVEDDEERLTFGEWCERMRQKLEGDK